MKTIVVGGTFDNHYPKESGVARKLSKAFEARSVMNGGPVADLRYASIYGISGHDLVVWMPNVMSHIEKMYPQKSRGSVLVCSKVMREGYTEMDAVSRIYKMHGNAVICIYPGEDKFEFQLVDALANQYPRTRDIRVLAHQIKRLYTWTKESIRMGSVEIGDIWSEIQNEIKSADRFMEIVHQVSDMVVDSEVGRFFGNASTRCRKLFPSARTEYDGDIWVSARDTDNSKLWYNDMIRARKVLCENGSQVVGYFGKKKPSVDTPVQLSLYDMFPSIDYMIHGHAMALFAPGAPVTENYYPCGDMREVEEIAKLLNDGCSVINLRDHGFLICARTMNMLENIVNEVSFGEIRRRT